jgi:hypothetical protein
MWRTVGCGNENHAFFNTHVRSSVVSLSLRWQELLLMANNVRLMLRKIIMRSSESISQK